MRGINAGNPKRVRWAHLARSGSQSKDRIHFTLSTGAASNVINQNIPFYHPKLHVCHLDKHLQIKTLLPGQTIRYISSMILSLLSWLYRFRLFLFHKKP